MINKLKLSNIIQIIVVTLLVVVMLGIWPTGLIHRTSVNRTSELADVVEPAEISDISLASQPFVTDGTRLRYVDVMLTNVTPGAEYDFSLYDDKSRLVCHVIRTIPEDFQVPGYIRIPTQVNVTRGSFYTYEISGVDSPLMIGYEMHANTGNSFCFAAVYDGAELSDYNTYATYAYGISFNTWQNVVIFIILAVLGLALCAMIRRYFDSHLEADVQFDVLVLERLVFTPVIVILTGILLFMVFPGRAFGTETADIILYDAGIALLSVYLLWVLWGRRSGIGSIHSGTAIVSELSSWLQPVCFAGALWQCYEYWNGLYDIFHEYAMRKMLCWFLLAIIVTFSRRELFNIINAIYLVAAAVFGYFYAKPHIGVQDEDLIYKLNAQIIILGGIVIIGIIRTMITSIREKKAGRIRIPYAVCTVLLFVLMSIFRNGYVWITVTWVMLLILSLRMLTWDKADTLSANICHGVICNYVFTVGYCLVHRPYRAFYYYRYGMLYHTVTVTAEYLTLVIAAALVLFIRRYHKIRVHNEQGSEAHRICYFTGMWKEMLLLGSALSYMLLTLSRTGFFAVIAMLIVTLGIYAIGMRTGIKATVDAVKMFVLAIVSIVMIASVFTFTRIVPAIFNEPVCSDIEIDGWEIQEGTASDDVRYMNLDRFIYCAREKLLGISDENGTEPVEEQQEARLDMFPAIQGAVLLTDEVSDEDVEQASEGIEQFSNGRIDLFKRYIAAWNLTGHDEMGVPMADGELAIHAHNSFLQAIHDFGMIAGFYVIIFGICSLITGCLVFRKVSGKDMYSLITPAVIIGFSAAGMTEWMFHICNPVGWTLFICVVPLLFADRSES